MLGHDLRSGDPSLYTEVESYRADTPSELIPWDMFRRLPFWLAVWALLEVIVLVLLFGSCAAAPAPWGPHHWNESARPVHVLVSDGLDAQCRAAVDEGLAFWMEQGVGYLSVEHVGPGHPAVNGLPRYREIGIGPGPLSDGAVAQTFRQFSSQGVYAADITLLTPEGCTSQTVAHELGHALGLDDLYEVSLIDRLMFWATAGGWKVSAEEQEFVQ